MDERRLDEFSKVEWWDVARKLLPGLSWEEFEALWEGFLLEQAKHRQH